MSVLDVLENYLEIVSNVLTNTFGKVYGVDFELYRADPVDPYTVYGADPDETSYNLVTTAKGILVPAYGFVDYSSEEAGVLDEAYLYASENLQPGDIVKILRSDTATKRYRVYAMEAIGITSPVIKRYRLRPLVD